MSPRSLLVNPPVLAADAHQVDLYAEAIPFGLLQIATHLSERGHDVTLLDLMEYRDGNFDEALSVSRHWGLKPLGDRTVRLRRPVYRVGRSLEWLEGRLAALPAPDEILVTCCIPFNNEPAHAVVSRTATASSRFATGLACALHVCPASDVTRIVPSAPTANP